RVSSRDPEAETEVRPYATHSAPSGGTEELQPWLPWLKLFPQMSCSFRLLALLNFLSQELLLCWLNVLPHSWQLNGRSPVWTLRWIFRFTACRKLLPQRSQLNGRRPLWMCWWFLRLTACRKVLGHCSHLKGFWPVWMRRCKHFPHSGHWNGRSPVCVRTWLCRLWRCRKARPQMLQENGFSPEWMRQCDFRLL
uniref:Uncharacterized protein n=1 Tax=Amphiprion percula TaxID=161767 RepID=A0A3P8SIC5_AMPPE